MTDAARGGEVLRAAAGGTPPRWAVVSGSGLSEVVDGFDLLRTLDYADVPGFPIATVVGHPGRLRLVKAHGVPVWICQGRPHFYEHGDMRPIATFVRILLDAGVTHLVLTNAAGALNPKYRPGDVMVVTDHLFLPGLAGHHPLLGPNDPRGERFPTLAGAYDAELRAALSGALRQTGLSVREGVYAMVSGPSFETSAETTLLRQAGADAVGMSTAPEVVIARHAGAAVGAVSTITNVAGVEDSTDEGHSAVVETASAVAPKLGRALAATIGKFGSG
ncbi:MAG: purine-nucleoside phosphorylase [Chloroflexota bacterium]|nr:purine-nucleoside phosphorylase [Chloroflexota bacterium]